MQYYQFYSPHKGQKLYPCAIERIPCAPRAIEDSYSPTPSERGCLEKAQLGQHPADGQRLCALYYSLRAGQQVRGGAASAAEGGVEGKKNQRSKRRLKQ
jgi:hypothetical protein